MTEAQVQQIFVRLFTETQTSIVKALDGALQQCKEVYQQAKALTVAERGSLSRWALRDDLEAMAAVSAYTKARFEILKKVKSKYADLDKNKTHYDAIHRIASTRFESEYPSAIKFLCEVARRKAALVAACDAFSHADGPHSPFEATQSLPVVILGTTDDGKYVRLRSDDDEPRQDEEFFLIEADRLAGRHGCGDLWRDPGDYDTVHWQDRNLRLARAASADSPVPEEGSLERRLLDDFVAVIEGCRAPRSRWKEDIISADLVRAIERRAKDKTRYGDAHMYVDYGVFKQSGTPEYKYGDICLVVSTNDGQRIRTGVCYIEAKKVHDVDGAIRSIDKNQLDRISKSGVPTYVLIYDLWASKLWYAAIAPLSKFLESSLIRPNMGEIGKPLSAQMVHEFFWGRGLSYDRSTLQGAAGAAGRYASNIVYARVGFGDDYEMAHELCLELDERWDRMIQRALGMGREPPGMQLGR